MFSHPTQLPAATAAVTAHSIYSWLGRTSVILRILPQSNWPRRNALRAMTSQPLLETGRPRQLPPKEAAERTAHADETRKSIERRSARTPQSDHSNRRCRRTCVMSITLATRNRTLAGGLRNFLRLGQPPLQLNLDRSADSHQLMILKSMQTAEKCVHAVAS
jgi:hypothetical protein